MASRLYRGTGRKATPWRVVWPFGTGCPPRRPPILLISSPYAALRQTTCKDQPAMNPIERLSRRQLVVVTGKGGVGKTVVSATLGRTFAALGRRTLVVEVDPRENLHQMIGTPPSGGDILQAEPRLWVQNLKPRQVLDEIVRDQLKLELLTRRVLDSPIYHHFSNGAPGLKEMAILGHAYRLLHGKAEPGSPQIDTVVLDAPATGHGVTLLAAPLLVADVIKNGPFCRMARELARLMSPIRSAAASWWSPRPRRCRWRRRSSCARPSRAGPARRRAAGGQRPVSAGAGGGPRRPRREGERAGLALAAPPAAQRAGAGARCAKSGRARASSCRSSPWTAGRRCSRSSGSASPSPPRSWGREHGPDLRPSSADHRRRLRRRGQDHPGRLHGRCSRPARGATRW